LPSRSATTAWNRRCTRAIPLIINTADRQFLDGVAFAINYEGQLSLKRMMRDGGEWWLASDHPDQRRFPRKLYRVGDCNPIGRIVCKQSAQI